MLPNVCFGVDRVLHPLHERVVVGLLLRERDALIVDLLLQADDFLLLRAGIGEPRLGVRAERLYLVRELLVLTVHEDHRLHACRELGDRL